MIEIECLDDLFSRVELYNDLNFNIYDLKTDGKYHLNKEELDRLLLIINLDKKSIDSYCVHCKKTYSFDVEIESSCAIVQFGSRSAVISFGDGIFIDFAHSQTIGFDDILDEYDLFEQKYCFLQYIFKCNKNNSHIYRMNLVVFCENGKVTIKKIGQYPSMIDVWGFSFDKYKNQLNKFDAYSNFKKAELCMADSLCAGAFTYLRRVFEKMLNFYNKGTTLKDNHVETKIKACIDKFDDRIKPMLNKLYKILSKGIHELSDEQSEGYYIYLRTVIEMQLEFVKQKNDKEKQTAELNKQLDSISLILDD